LIEAENLKETTKANIQIAQNKKQKTRQKKDAKRQVALSLVDDDTCKYVDDNLPPSRQVPCTRPIYTNSYLFCLAHAMEMGEIEPRAPTPKKRRRLPDARQDRDDEDPRVEDLGDMDVIDEQQYRQAQRQ
jgi:hypothetical protein